MLITIFNVLYLLVFLILVLMSLFVVFHIVRYSYDKMETAIMLLLFLPTASALIFANFVLYFSIPFDNILPVFVF